MKVLEQMGEWFSDRWGRLKKLRACAHKACTRRGWGEAVPKFRKGQPFYCRDKAEILRYRILPIPNKWYNQA